ncbi:hypothetical protein ACFL35_03580 [Candidatus Riflebacteria bacterium]
MKLPDRKIRYLIYIALIGFYFYYTWWSPDIVLESEHFIARSTAAKKSTQIALQKVELLYKIFKKEFQANNFAFNPDVTKFKLVIYKTRAEYKRVNPFIGWAEAFYNSFFSCCYQYIDEKQNNPYFWMQHEVTHQLVNELLLRKYPKWLNEGIACYFSTGLVKDDEIILGTIDRWTYPIWWLPTLNLSGQIARDVENKRIVRLNDLIRDTEPLPMDAYFNRYYMLWWGTIHFLIHFDNGKYRKSFFDFLKIGGKFKDFAKQFGPVDLVEKEWYSYLYKISERFKKKATSASK